MIEIKLPSLGEGVEKGTVVTILVKKGDVVSIEQPLIEVETDKVTAEVPSEFEGTIQSVLVAIGDEIAEGAPILQISRSGVPIHSTEITYETVVEPKEDSKVKSSHHSSQPKTDSKELSIESTFPIESIDLNPEDKKFRASPLARKVAREIGVNISDVSIPDDHARISVQDVKNHAKQRLSKLSKFKDDRRSFVVLPDFNRHGQTERVPMTSIANATARNMTQAWTQIPHAWLQEKVDITDLEGIRKELKEEVRASGGALTITIILVKAISKTLEKYPLFNASVDEKNKELIFKKYINIGVAVDTMKGLVVPVIKEVNQKSLTALSIELTELSAKAREGKLTSDDISGATFTISNLGGIGTTGIFPIVNFPQAAILGVAGSSIESIWKEDGFQPRLIMPVTLGFDHRIINGADAARFLKYIKRVLENWFVISL